MITVLTTRSFPIIEKEWDTLYRQNSKLSYYQSTEYMNVLWNHFFPYRLILRGLPRFFVFMSGGKPCFILPLFKKWFKKDYCLFGYKMGLGYLDAVYSENITSKDITECFDELKRCIGQASIYFMHVREKTELGQWILANGGCISPEGCTEIQLPDNYDVFFDSLSKHMKQNIRTAYNRLKTDEMEYRFECIPYSDMPEITSRRLQKMYINRQKIRYEKSLLYSLFVKYVDLGTKIQKHGCMTVRAYVLSINNKIAAFFDAIYAGNTIIIPRLAISDEFNRYSPGVMLINESIKNLIDERVSILDLTHGMEQYKLSMGGIVNHCVEKEMKLK